MGSKADAAATRLYQGKAGLSIWKPGVSTSCITVITIVFSFLCASNNYTCWGEKGSQFPLLINLYPAKVNFG
jgi:hypothetical protein